MNILLKSDRSLEELSLFLRELFGCQVAASSSDCGTRLDFRSLDFVFCAYDNAELEDDGGIPLSSYQVVIGMDESSVGQVIHGYDTLAQSLAHYLAARLSVRFECEARVMRGLQQSLGVYAKGVLVEEDRTPKLASDH